MDLKHLITLCLGISAGVGIGSSGLMHQQPVTVNDFPDLVAGLKQTPGVLDVKTTAFNEGKQGAIFAWFENKKAVQAWYGGEMHQAAMRKFFPKHSGRAIPLSTIVDEKAPLLVIATVSPSDKPMIEGSPLAVSQIAIEIYTPAPGGVAFGGSFGPKNLQVPGMIRVDAKPSG